MNRTAYIGFQSFKKTFKSSLPGLCNFFKLRIINILDAVNGVLFRKTVSNKFITAYNFVFNMLCYVVTVFPNLIVTVFPNSKVRAVAVLV